MVAQSFDGVFLGHKHSHKGCIVRFDGVFPLLGCRECIAVLILPMVEPITVFGCRRIGNLGAEGLHARTRRYTTFSLVVYGDGNSDVGTRYKVSLE